MFVYALLGFIFGTLFIIIFLDYLEAFMQKENRKAEKWVSATLFGITIATIIFSLHQQ